MRHIVQVPLVGLEIVEALDLAGGGDARQHGVGGACHIPVEAQGAHDDVCGEPERGLPGRIGDLGHLKRMHGAVGEGDVNIEVGGAGKAGGAADRHHARGAVDVGNVQLAQGQARVVLVLRQAEEVGDALGVGNAEVMQRRVAREELVVVLAGDERMLDDDAGDVVLLGVTDDGIVVALVAGAIDVGVVFLDAAVIQAQGDKAVLDGLREVLSVLGDGGDAGAVVGEPHLGTMGIRRVGRVDVDAHEHRGTRGDGIGDAALEAFCLVVVIVGEIRAIAGIVARHVDAHAGVGLQLVAACLGDLER